MVSEDSDTPAVDDNRTEGPVDLTNTVHAREARLAMEQIGFKWWRISMEVPSSLGLRIVGIYSEEVLTPTEGVRH